MSFRLALVVLGGLVAAGVAACPALEGFTAPVTTGSAPAPREGVDPPQDMQARAVAQTIADDAAEAAEPAPNEAKPDDAQPDAQPVEPTEPVEPDDSADDDTADDDTADDTADEEEHDETWVGPPDAIPDCEAKLAAAGVEFKASRIPLHKTRSGIYCGAEQIVRYRRGPGAISWGGSPQVTCPVALALAKLEGIVQEESERHFGRKVKRIQHMGTYNCREMANYPGWVSEHSYANAIDIKHFELSGGKKIPVLGKYPRDGAEPKNDSARFLKAVARRLYDEHVFSVVLTPSFDAAHRNHFHLDMARYLVDGT